MRILMLGIALLAMTCAFAAPNATATENITLEILSYLDVQLPTDVLVIAPGAADSSTAVTKTTTVTVHTNQGYALASRVEDNASTPVVGQLSAGAYHLTGVTTGIAPSGTFPLTYGLTGDAGQTGTVTITVPRDGLDDHSGNYSGKLVVTIN